MLAQLVRFLECSIHSCSHYAHSWTIEAVLVAHDALILELFEAVSIVQVVFLFFVRCCERLV